ncbi:hypothetical protein IEQ34_000553 [Dendrobium chrysotoxum]|uniref:Protein kinase G11A n=1 Tax=Dendrobium chrysotoxum TaxID=161865 RepID=A0AAV7HRM9_DENCH|nr:hypothetical protein IEQ34_000553 [Dendrobium chrysotoxum]
MGSFGGTSEIIESREEFNFWNHSNGPKLPRIKLREGEGKSHGFHAEDDLQQVIEAIDLRLSPRVLGFSRRVLGDMQKKDLSKKPIRIGASQASGIGVSESVTMKQALRRLCITQASELAAMKRSKPIGLSRVSEAGTIKSLYTSMVLEENKCGISVGDRKRNLFEISIAPETACLNSSHKGIQVCSSCHAEFSRMESLASPINAALKPNLTKKRIQCITASLSKAVSAPHSAASTPKSCGRPSGTAEVDIKRKACNKACMSNLDEGSVLSKPSISPRMTKTTVKSKFPSKKGIQEPAQSTGSSNRCVNVNEPGEVSSETKLGCLKPVFAPSGAMKHDVTVGVKHMDNVLCNYQCSPNNCGFRNVTASKLTNYSRSKEKGNYSQSSMSSLGDNSSSTSNSDESNQSGSSVVRPHMSKDVRWTAIHHALNQHGGLDLMNFKLIKKLGCGDIGTVYLAELTGSGCLFALKVMDVEFLISRKKILRAQTERDILQMLDHPFLPTLFSYFTTDNLLCLVMEYCPGGDLHILRQRQNDRRFSEPEARFYVAEVLLALEYLHMLGVIYRDLKPENILVREDGHIMLSDFDLSLRCTVNPVLLRSSSLGWEEARTSGPCAESSCINPHCLHPSWPQISCFTPRLISSSKAKTQKIRSDAINHITPLPQLVAEPSDARSNSFVGTHEYLSPEIIKGDGHGSAVDWWTFGIFLYELLYGMTPFKGSGNEETLANVVSKTLKFPETPAISLNARDLIERLLVKDPDNRLGSVKGSAEIKRHPFFEGLNWALIRCAAPPEVPGSFDLSTPLAVCKIKEGKSLTFSKSMGDVEFELF